MTIASLGDIKYREVFRCGFVFPYHNHGALSGAGQGCPRSLRGPGGSALAERGGWGDAGEAIRGGVVGLAEMHGPGEPHRQPGLLGYFSLTFMFTQIKVSKEVPVPAEAALPVFCGICLISWAVRLF